LSKKIFSKEFKLQVIQELHAGKRPAEIAREHDLKIDAICRWRKAYEQNPQHAFAGKGNIISLEARNAELERKIGQLYLQVEFVKKVNAGLQAMLAEAKKNGK